MPNVKVQMSNIRFRHVSNNILLVLRTQAKNCCLRDYLGRFCARRKDLSAFRLQKSNAKTFEILDFDIDLAFDICNLDFLCSFNRSSNAPDSRPHGLLFQYTKMSHLARMRDMRTSA